jgi:hypothetical protein
MSHTERQLEQLLDQAVEGLRSEAMNPAESAAVAQRVWLRLETEWKAQGQDEAPPSPFSREIRGCEGYQALFPTYLMGTLPKAQRLLLEDHTRECIPCRRALKAARSGESTEAAPPPRMARWTDSPFLRMAATVALVVGLAFGAWKGLERLPLGWGQHAAIAEAEGGIYRMTRDGYIPVTTGDALDYGDVLRTARGSGAVLELPDGSRVELSERAEMEVVRRIEGTTIRLHRGNIIVEAAEQGSGRLFVRTPDCRVAVKGTIFAVNNGTKGSRVSVIEGEVEVDYGAEKAVLNPGEQVSTHPSLGPVPVSQEIAWSRNLDEYLRLLEELNALRKDLHQAMASPSLRYSTRLLELAPPGTTFYAGIPNLSTNVLEAHRLIQERMATSPILEAWWNEVFQSGAVDLDAILQQVAEFGDHLGDEIAVAMPVSAVHDAQGPPPGLLMLAETADGEALRTYLEGKFTELNHGEGNLILVDDPSTVPPGGDPENRVLIWVRPELVALAVDPGALQQLAATLDGEPNPFVGEALYGELAEVYSHGADWVVAADMERILVDRLAAEDPEDVGRMLELTGMADISQLVLERKQSTDSTTVNYRATVSFDGPRRGLAGWIAEPAPMASLEFISPEANLVSAFLLKDPAQLVEDLLAILGPSGANLEEQLQLLAQTADTNLLEDLAATLGGEIALAVDGPMLPTPSWKVITEVYDAPRLQNTLERLIERIGVMVMINGERWLTLDRETHGGRTYYTIRITKVDTTVYYTYEGGYLIAGPSRAILDRAVQYRNSGYTLTSSARFAALLPQDGHANFSGLTYQNLQSVLGPLADFWSRTQGAAGSAGVTEEQQGKIQELLAQAPATLACVYAEPERIVFVNNSEDDIFTGLLGLGGALGIEGMMDELMRRQGVAPPTGLPVANLGNLP